MAEINLYSGGYKIYTTIDQNVQNTLEAELAKEKYAIKRYYIFRTTNAPQGSICCL